MSRRVEENEVKMRFDNSEFDSNIEQSEKTLSKFKTSLLSLPSEIALGLSNILSRINLADVLGFAGVIAGINLVKNAIGGIGNTIEGVAAKAMNAVNTVFQNAYNQIKSGGMQRALNIEAAKFQIEGLKLDVDTFMEAADYAVSGTAYSLDAAAKAASQLGASGITQLEDLKKALRGISGVAAMANADYESIAHIFTTVAGQGKLMTEQLNSLSYRGLNAAADLGKALGKTESEIREMVSKGQIDFRTFAMAMDDAFGEHAKDANKTFTGAMSNIRAALSRIGEAFATPYIQNMIGVYNEIRLAVNAFKTELGENQVFNVFAEGVEYVTDKLEKMIDWLKKAIQESALIEELSYLWGDAVLVLKQIVGAFSFSYAGQIKQIANNVSVLVNKVKQVVWALKEAVDEVIGITNIGSFFTNLLIDASYLLQAFDEINDIEVKEVFVSWMQALKGVLEVITDILGINKDSITNLFTKAVGKVFEIFKNLKLTDDEIDKIKRTMRGIVSIADIIKMLAVSIFDFVKPIFSYVRPLIDLILTGTAALGDWLYNLRNIVKEQELFDRIFEKVTDAIVFIKEVIKNIGTNFFDAFFGDATKDSSFLDKLKAFIESIGETISQMFSNMNIQEIDFGPIKDFISSIFRFGITQGDAETTEEHISIIERIWEKIKEFFSKIKEFFSSDLFNFNKDDEDKGSNLVESFGKGIGKVFTGISDFIKDTGLSDVEIIAATALIWHLLDVTRDILVAFFNFAIELAKIIAGFTADEKVMGIISKFFEKGTEGVISGIFHKLEQFMADLKSVDFVELIHGRESKAGIYAAVAEVIKDVAWLLMAIAASLYIIALIPENDLKKAADTLLIVVAIVGVIFGAILVLSRVLNSTGGLLINVNALNPKLIGGGTSNLDAFARGLKNMAMVFVAIGAALFLITKAQQYGDVEKSALIVGIFVVAITIILGAFAILESHIGRVGTDLKSIGLAFAFVGAACLLIAAAITAIASVTKTGEEDKIWRAFGVINITLVVMGLILGLVGSFASAGTVIATGGAMLLMCAGIAIACTTLASAIATLARIEDPDRMLMAMDVVETILIVVGVIVGVMSIIGLIAGAIGPWGVLALAIIAINLGTVAAAIIGIGPALAAAALVIKTAMDFMEAYQNMIVFLGNMNEEDADKAVRNGAKILAGLAMAIPEAFGAYLIGMTQAFASMFPQLLGFIGSGLLPFLNQVSEILFPPLITNIINGITLILVTLTEQMPLILSTLHEMIFGTTGGGILVTLFEWADQIWDDTVSWLNDRIPVMVPDIFMLVLTLIRSINLALEENWTELDSETQKLIDNSMALIRDLLTGEKTTEDIGMMLGAIINTVVQVLGANAPVIMEAFREIGKIGFGAFVDALTGGEESGFGSKVGDFIKQLLDIPEDYNPTVTMDFDYSNVTNGLNDMDGMLNGFTSGSYNLGGIGYANSIPFNQNSMQTQLNDALKGLSGFNSGKNNTTVTTYTSMQTDPYRMFNVMTDVEVLQSQAGLGG